MNIIESSLSLIAPHRCVGCGQKGYVLCDVCASEALAHSPSRCYRCHAVSRQYATCTACRAATGIHNMWVSCQYEGVAVEVVELMKFHRASAAALDIAREINARMPLLPTDTLVTYAPTAHSRVRQRGFDQSERIARSLAQQRSLRMIRAFKRVTDSRQLGASRGQRIAQAQQTFDSNMALSSPVLIIDDVSTSGATIEALARLARKAGAPKVYAAVFAQAID